MIRNYVKCQATTCILHFTKVNVNNGAWVQEDWNIGGWTKLKFSFEYVAKFGIKVKVTTWIGHIFISLTGTLISYMVNFMYAQMVIKLGIICLNKNVMVCLE